MARQIIIRTESGNFCPYHTPLLFANNTSHPSSFLISMSCDGRAIYHGFLCGSASPRLIAVGHVRLRWVGDRWSKNGQVREFGAEFAPP